jgi:hypothetical protein
MGRTHDRQGIGPAEQYALISLDHAAANPDRHPTWPPSIINFRHRRFYHFEPKRQAVGSESCIELDMFELEENSMSKFGC